MNPSFRTNRAERRYQKMKRNGELPGLDKEPRIKVFKHWYVTVNRAPGNKMFDEHLLLCPFELVGDWDELSQATKNEYWYIRKTYIMENGYLVYENPPILRSVKGHYHKHLAKFKPRLTLLSVIKRGVKIMRAYHFWRIKRLSRKLEHHQRKVWQ